MAIYGPIAAITTLSYGHQRFVEIARSLVGTSSVILLDEPAAGLGSSEINVLADAIHQIKDTGKTLIVVEHNMPFITDISAPRFGPHDGAVGGSVKLLRLRQLMQRHPIRQGILEPFPIRILGAFLCPILIAAVAARPIPRCPTRSAVVAE